MLLQREENNSAHVTLNCSHNIYYNTGVHFLFVSSINKLAAICESQLEETEQGQFVRTDKAHTVPATTLSCVSLDSGHHYYLVYKRQQVLKNNYLLCIHSLVTSRAVMNQSCC